MPALAREALLTACRTIYELAGENYVLPPLIRDARKLETQSSHSYRFPIDDRNLHFDVELDEACADRNASPFSKLPLRFRIELKDPDFPDERVELAESEKNALIYAFLLGVRAPLTVEKNTGDRTYDISIQLSSTYFVSCGELIDKGVEHTAQEICFSVAQELYENSKEFFENPYHGVTIWSVRAAQDLFGEPKPPSEMLWPAAHDAHAAQENSVARENRPAAQGSSGEPDLVVANFESVVVNEKAAWPYSRYAVAASIVLGLAGIATSLGFSGESVRPQPALKRIEIERAAPKLDRAAAAQGRYAAPLDPHPMLFSAAFVADAKPRIETQENAAPTSSGRRDQLPIGAKTATLVAPIPPPPAEAATTNSTASVRQPRKLAAAAAKSGDGDKSPQTGKKTRTQVASSKHEGDGSLAQDSQRIDNPLAFVGQTVDQITRRVVTDIKLIHYRLSSLTVR